MNDSTPSGRPSSPRREAVARSRLRREAMERLERASTLLAQSEMGRVEYEVAVPGAIRLIDDAIEWVNKGWPG